MRTLSSLRHLDAEAHPLIFEDNGDSINNTYAGIGFTMDYNFVLELLGPIRVRKMFFLQVRCTTRYTKRPKDRRLPGMFQPAVRK